MCAHLPQHTLRRRIAEDEADVKMTTYYYMSTYRLVFNYMLHMM